MILQDNWTAESVCYYDSFGSFGSAKELDDADLDFANGGCGFGNLFVIETKAWLESADQPNSC